MTHEPITNSDVAQHVTLCVLAYLAPAIIAWTRRMRNAMSITIVTVFLGWTLVGWVVALSWACAGKPARH